MGFLSVPWLIFQLESSLISFAGSHRTSTLQGGDKGRVDGERGDYFKYFRQWRAINRGTAIIRGNTVKASQFRASRFSTHLAEDLTECRETLNAPVFFTVFTLSTSLDFYGKQHRPSCANYKGVRTVLLSVTNNHKDILISS